MRITRRQFCQSSATFVLAAALLSSTALSPFAAAQAQGQAQNTVPTDELMKPDALPEMSMGNDKATVTVIEYASMTCPHCAHFQEATFPELKKRYIDTGKVRYIFREFPLDTLAAAAFMLARCAGDGKYYPIVDTLFNQQKDWAFAQNPIPPLSKIAKTFGFTDQSFEQCLSNQKLLDNMEEVRKQAQKFGVTSTPTFFINGQMFRGAMTPQELDKQVEPFLKAS